MILLLIGLCVGFQAVKMTIQVTGHPPWHYWSSLSHHNNDKDNAPSARQPKTFDDKAFFLTCLVFLCSGIFNFSGFLLIVLGLWLRKKPSPPALTA
jgi:hypothetical protein